MTTKTSRLLSYFIPLLENIVGKEYENDTFFFNIHDKTLIYKGDAGPITIGWYPPINHVFIIGGENYPGLSWLQFMQNCLNSIGGKE